MIVIPFREEFAEVKKEQEDIETADLLRSPALSKADGDSSSSSPATSNVPGQSLSTSSQPETSSLPHMMLPSSVHQSTAECCKCYCINLGKTSSY
jgi:hypothetical protein